MNNVETRNIDGNKHRFKLAQAVNWLLNIFKGLGDSANNQALISDGNGSLVFEEVITTEGGQTIAGSLDVTGTMTLADDLKIGTGANDYGWSDYLSSISAAKVAGTNPPTWSNYRNGLFAYEFSATKLEEVWMNFHINHDFKLGSAIFPHVHWSPNTTGTGTVRWGIEYTISKGHQQSVFGATTIVYVEQTMGAANQYSHQIAEVSTGISSAELEVDSVVMMRVFRDASHVNDTFTTAVFGLFVDLHVQVDRTSTLNKAPNFYT